MIHEVDPNNDGEVDFNEFMELMAKKTKDTEIEEELKEAFKTFDKSGRGHFTLDELK